MRLILLAAGRGSRMKSLTEDSPKCSLSIGSSSLFELQLKAASELGISKISVVTGYKSNYFDRFNVAQIHNELWSKTNMVYSLLLASNLLLSETCLISYSDIFYFSAGLKVLTECGDEFALLYDPHWHKLWSQRFADPLIDAETFAFSDENFLTSIGQKINNPTLPEGQYMGLLKTTPSAWQKIIHYLSTLDADIIHRLDLTSLLNILIDNNVLRMRVYPYDGVWGEVDHPSDLDLYRSWTHLV